MATVQGMKDRRETAQTRTLPSRGGGVLPFPGPAPLPPSLPASTAPFGLMLCVVAAAAAAALLSPHPTGGSAAPAAALRLSYPGAGLRGALERLWDSPNLAGLLPWRPKLSPVERVLQRNALRALTRARHAVLSGGAAFGQGSERPMWMLSGVRRHDGALEKKAAVRGPLAKAVTALFLSLKGPLPASAETSVFPKATAFLGTRAGTAPGTATGTSPGLFGAVGTGGRGNTGLPEGALGISGGVAENGAPVGLGESAPTAEATPASGTPTPLGTSVRVVILPAEPLPPPCPVDFAPVKKAPVVKSGQPQTPQTVKDKALLAQFFALGPQSSALAATWKPGCAPSKVSGNFLLASDGKLLENEAGEDYFLSLGLDVPPPPPPPSDPLVFDLTGKGVAASRTEIRFDLLGTGRPQKIHDIAPGMGVLAFDAGMDGDPGKDGRGLFGNSTDLLGKGRPNGFTEGFQALAAFVLKAEWEGVLAKGASDRTVLGPADIAALERAYGLSIKVGSLLNPAVSLHEAGVQSITLSYAPSILLEDIDEHGNGVATRVGAHFTRADGTTGKYADLFLAFVKK